MPISPDEADRLLNINLPRNANFLVDTLVDYFDENLPLFRVFNRYFKDNRDIDNASLDSLKDNRIYERIRTIYSKAGWSVDEVIDFYGQRVGIKFTRSSS